MYNDWRRDCWKKARENWLENKIKQNIQKYVSYGAFANYTPAYEIERVIFNEPATIVFWKDGTKTVVKCCEETFDPEKGIAMAFMKKVRGENRAYYREIKKWSDKYYEEKVKDCDTVGDAIIAAFKDVFRFANDKKGEK